MSSGCRLLRWVWQCVWVRQCALLREMTESDRDLGRQDKTKLGWYLMGVVGIEEDLEGSAAAG